MSSLTSFPWMTRLPLAPDRFHRPPASKTFQMENLRLENFFKGRMADRDSKNQRSGAISRAKRSGHWGPGIDRKSQLVSRFLGLIQYFLVKNPVGIGQDFGFHPELFAWMKGDRSRSVPLSTGFLKSSRGPSFRLPGPVDCRWLLVWDSGQIHSFASSSISGYLRESALLAPDKIGVKK